MWNSKPKKSGHDCRGRAHGNPKVGGGICRLGVRPAVRTRITNKRLANRWLAAARARTLDDIDE
jgi:hypothetical protein